MRHTLIPILAILPHPASAHVGHLGELAGHGHWIALGALVIATVVGALASATGKDKRANSEDEAATEEDSDSQEAAA